MRCGVRRSGMLMLMLGAVGAAGAEPARKDLYGDPLPPGAVLRLGSVRLRHRAQAVVFAPDGKSLISAGPDGTVRYWDPATGAEVRRVRVQTTERLQSPVELSADGNRVAAKVGDGLRVWDAATGRELSRTPIGKPSGYTLALSADGKKLAAFLMIPREAPVIRVWDVDAGKERATLFATLALGMTFSADGKHLAAATLEAMHLWELPSGKEVGKFPGPLFSLVFSPDGRRVAAADRQQMVHVWSVPDGRELAAFKETHGEQVVSVVFSPDGETVAVGTLAGTTLHDAAGRKPSRRLAGRGWLTFAPDGKTLACSMVGPIRLWDVATGHEVAPRPGHDGTVTSLAVAPDGRRLASLSPTDPNVRLWDLASGEQRAALRGDPKYRWHAGAFSADGKQFATGATGGPVRLWDTANGRELRTFPVELRNSEGRENPEVPVVALPPEGRQLAAVSVAWHTRQGGHPVYQLDVWDRDTGASVVRRKLPMTRWAARFSPDGRALAYRTSDGVVVEGVATGTEYVRLPAELGWPFAFSPDGQILAATLYRAKKVPSEELGPADAKAVVLTELASGRRLLRIDTGPGGFQHLAYAPDGRSLATTDADGFRLWDAATGEELSRRALPEKHPAPGYSFATSLVFLPSGDRLATGLLDGTILVWDLGPRTPRKGVAIEELDRQWADLAGEDAERAHRAEWALAAVPAKAVPFLKDHLRPAPAADATKLRRLIADLDGEQFAVRERAAKELADVGEQAGPALRKALEGKPGLEVRKRLEELLAGAEAADHGVVRSPGVLRTLRAVRALEAIGTDDARQVLGMLAGGDPAARTTRQAKEALRRLDAMR